MGQTIQQGQPSGADATSKDKEQSFLTTSLLIFGGMLASVVIPVFLVKTVLGIDLSSTNMSRRSAPVSPATPYSEQDCKLLHDIFACRNLGEIYATGQGGVPLDYAKAAEYFAKGCEIPDGLACKVMGELYFEGKGVPQDYTKAAAYSAKGCELQNGSACGNLGTLYFYGYGVPLDHARAAEYYSKGCELQVDYACRNSGLIYANGYGVTQDYDKAAKYYAKGCELNDAESCTALSKLAEIGHGGGSLWR